MEKKVAIEGRSHDFHKGYPLSQGWLEQYRNECAQGLLAHPEQNTYSIRTGNMYTNAIRQEDGSITVIQCSSGYIEYNYRVETVD